MSATAEQVARLRRLCALAADDPAWTDEVLAEIIERYPLVDVHDGTTRYDMPAAIAEVWSAKAAALAGRYDVTGDGASRSLSQQYTQALQQAHYWSARRALASRKVLAAPREDVDEYLTL